MKRMSPDECRAFLSRGCRTAKLATVRKDGRPHVAPVWFIVDGHDIVFMTLETSLKGRTLQRDPRAMISVDDEAFPFGFVLAEGEATVERPTTEVLLPWSRRIAARYVPEDRVEVTAQRNAVEGELLVRVPMSKLTGMREVAA
jgi:PPOX class probable F420-dependent enzyme